MYKLKKEEVKQRNVLEEIAHRLLDQAKRKVKKPEDSIVPGRRSTEPAITEYEESREVFHHNRQVLENNKHLGFVKRLFNPERNPLALEGRDPETGETYIETHRMAAEVIGEGTPREKWIVYPTIVEEVPGKLTRKNYEDAKAYALRTREYIDFGASKEEKNFRAIDFSKDYKSAVPEFTTYFEDVWRAKLLEEPDPVSSPSFNTTFKAARGAGDETFIWQGKEYHTRHPKETAGDAEQVLETTPEPEPELEPEEERISSTIDKINNIDLRLPLNVRQLAHDIMGGTDPITKANLKDSEYQALIDATRNAISRGSSRIEYEDYLTQKDSRTGSQYRDVGGGGTNIEFLSLLDDPSYALKTTLGQAIITMNKEGEVIIKDRYNFSNATDKFNFIDFAKGIKNAGFSFYAQSRNVGTFLGSGPGEGSIVEINLGKLNETETLKLEDLLVGGGS